MADLREPIRLHEVWAHYNRRHDNKALPRINQKSVDLDREGRLVLADADLSECDLSSATLAGARFERCSFARLTMTFFNIQDTELVSCDFSEIALYLSSLSGAAVRDCRFSGSRFETCYVEETKIVGGDWTASGPTWSVWSDAIVEEVDFTGSDFEHTTLRRTTFSKCVFRGASFKDVEIEASTFDSCDFRDVDFGGCSITNAKFNNCAFHGARGPADLDDNSEFVAANPYAVRTLLAPLDIQAKLQRLLDSYEPGTRGGFVIFRNEVPLQYVQFAATPEGLSFNWPSMNGTYESYVGSFTELLHGHGFEQVRADGSALAVRAYQIDKDGVYAQFGRDAGFVAGFVRRAFAEVFGRYDPRTTKVELEL